jgi:hypothetical protein
MSLQQLRSLLPRHLLLLPLLLAELPVPLLVPHYVSAALLLLLLLLLLLARHYSWRMVGDQGPSA